MRYGVLVLLAVLGVACGSSGQDLGVSGEPVASAPSEEAQAILALFPPAGTKADVLGAQPLTGPAAGLADKMGAAIAEDPEWFSEFLASVPPGEPLPYHPRLGLSEDEYAVLSAALEDTEATVISQTTIGTEVDANGRWAFTGSTPTGDLRQIAFDSATMAFQTPFGETGPAEPWSSTDPSSYLGTAQGWRWERMDPGFVNPDTLTGSFIEITFAVRELDGRVYLAVRGGQLEQGVPISSVDIDLLYHPPSL